MTPETEREEFTMIVISLDPGERLLLKELLLQVDVATTNDEDFNTKLEETKQNLLRKLTIGDEEQKVRELSKQVEEMRKEREAREKEMDEVHFDYAGKHWFEKAKGGIQSLRNYFGGLTDVYLDTFVL